MKRLLTFCSTISSPTGRFERHIDALLRDRLYIHRVCLLKVPTFFAITDAERVKRRIRRQIIDHVDDITHDARAENPLVRRKGPEPLAIHYPQPGKCLPNRRQGDAIRC